MTTTAPTDASTTPSTRPRRWTLSDRVLGIALCVGGALLLAVAVVAWLR